MDKIVMKQDTDKSSQFFFFKFINVSSTHLCSFSTECKSYIEQDTFSLITVYNQNTPIHSNTLCT